jgi:hypothetical protein
VSMASLRSLLGASGVITLGCTLIVAADSAGCQPAVRTFQNGSTSGTGGTSGVGGFGGGFGGGLGGGFGGAGGGSTSSSSSSSTSGTVTCTTGSYAGPLCGPASAPCTVHTDEVLPDDPTSRNDAPGVAIDSSCSPHVLYTVAGSGSHGFYASRGAGADGGVDAGGGDGGDAGGDGGTPYLGPWTVETAPFIAAAAGLVIPPGASPLAVADDGALGVTLWSRAGGTWAKVEQASGMLQFWSNGLGADAQGTLHATFKSSANVVNYGIYASGWAVTTLSATPSGTVPLAVSSTGVAQFSYWTAGNADAGAAGGLAWASATAPNTPEIASATAIGNTSLAITVTPPTSGNPDGVPYILFARPVAGGATAQELAYATRTGANAWTTVTVDSQSANNVMCTAAPVLGASCAYSYDQLQPIAAVASRGGDVRFIYEKYRRQGTYRAICAIFGGMVNCHWVPDTDTSTGQIFVASVGAAAPTVTTAPVVSAIMADSGTAIVDSLGHIHLAVYDSYPPSQGGATVRYVELGP